MADWLDLNAEPAAAVEHPRAAGDVASTVEPGREDVLPVSAGKAGARPPPAARPVLFSSCQLSGTLATTAGWLYAATTRFSGGAGALDEPHAHVLPTTASCAGTRRPGAVSVFRKPSNYANGNTRDRQGRLVTCEHDARRVTRTEYDGTITVLIDQFDGKPLNSPNDVVVKSDGSIWFTDPPFGILGNYEGHVATPELPTNVYRLDPKTGRATVVDRRRQPAQRPRFSPDESEALHRRGAASRRA